MSSNSNDSGQAIDKHGVAVPTVLRAARRLGIAAGATLLLVLLRSAGTQMERSASGIPSTPIRPPAVGESEAPWESTIIGHAYPGLANIYLSHVSGDRAAQLARWDVVALNTATAGRVEVVREIRRLNPSVVLLVHQNGFHVPKSPGAALMRDLFRGVRPEWWVLEPGSLLMEGVSSGNTRLVVEEGGRFQRGDDVQVGSEQMVVVRVEGDTLVVERGQYGSSVVSHGVGERVAAHVARNPERGHWMANVDGPFSDYLADFLHSRVFSTGLWDGVLYDVVFEHISGVNGGEIDLDRDGERDDTQQLNERWRRGMVRLFERTRASGGDRLVMGNGRTLFYEAHLNGKEIEDFPGARGWQDDMENYWRTLREYRSPQLVILNRRSTSESDYRAMRFGLASALMGDGYYSFDAKGYHGDTWWYDEYEVDLGMPLGGASQVGGIWRRDFEGGVVLVNPGSSPTEVDLGGTYRKIQGTQDPAINDGSLVTKVTIGPKDGLILLRGE